MRILVIGAGVIGSVYAGKLLAAGHDVVVLARGSRRVELETGGLILEDAESGIRVVVTVPSVSEVAAEDRFDLALVPVRSEQLAGTLSIVTRLGESCDVLFFGNTAGQQNLLIAAVGERALFGFPAAGGVRDGPVVKYVLIKQQQTMLGEASGATTPRLRRLQALMVGAGFPTTISANIDDWLIAHAAFVVPVAFALYRNGTDPRRLAADRVTIKRMVLATRQTFKALRTSGNAEIPRNLRILYLRLPMAVVIGYWRRVFASPRGELWFAAHCRAAPEEMRAIGEQLQTSLRRTGLPTPELDSLLVNESVSPAQPGP